MENIDVSLRENGARERRLCQARIHTCFHRFTEIGQIFHNKYFSNNKNISKFKPRQYPAAMTRKPRKGDFKS